MDSAAPGARYITDVPYTRRFVRELSPSWLDFTALICGFAPPRREGGFAWCELGCGHGVTPTLLAALHPEAVFHGIDLMPQHAESGRALSRDAGVENVHFEAVDFAAAAALDLPGFDYIVAHGVYTWIDEAAQADLLRFVERRLRPGGLVYLSYDCLPGWAGDMPLQHLLRVLADRAEGDSIARLESADRIVAAMAGLGAEALRLGAMGREWPELRRRLPPGYFVHQFLPPAWRPLYVTELRAEVARFGLKPLGSATIRENVDAFTLERPARELVAAAADPDLRELLRDYLLMKRFRRDLFGRDVAALDAEAVRTRLVAGRYMLSPASDDGVPFNDAPAREILAALADGAASLAAATGGQAIDAMVSQLIALVSAGRVWPVAAAADPQRVDRANAAIRRRRGTADEIPFTLLADGTAIEIKENAA